MRKINLKNKKGMSHIEVILSFVIFLSFMVFLLIVFKPLKIFSRTSSANLDITENEILKQVSTELIIKSVNINVFPSGNCFYITKPEEIVNKVIVRDEDNNQVSSESDTGNIYFTRSGGGNFYRIYSSEEFTEDSLLDCVRVTDYSLGAIRKYDLVSNSSLTELFLDYNENYEQLKNQLGLKNEFIMSVRDSSGMVFLEVLEGKYKPSGIEIMARDIPIEVLDSDGNLIPYILNIQTWE